VGFLWGPVAVSRTFGVSVGLARALELPGQPTRAPGYSNLWVPVITLRITQGYRAGLAGWSVHGRGRRALWRRSPVRVGKVTGGLSGLLCAGLELPGGGVWGVQRGAGGGGPVLRGMRHPGGGVPGVR
jgi:hypothetical protein